jgi:hypothetical protein
MAAGSCLPGIQRQLLPPSEQPRPKRSFAPLRALANPFVNSVTSPANSSVEGIQAPPPPLLRSPRRETMHRRSFLSLAAGTVSAAALGQSSASVATPAAHEASSLAHPVLAHQDRTGDLHRRPFSTVAFKVVTQDTQGSLFAMESTSLKKGGPPATSIPIRTSGSTSSKESSSRRSATSPSPSTPATPSSVRVAYPTPGPASATALEDCS